MSVRTSASSPAQVLSILPGCYPGLPLSMGWPWLDSGEGPVLPLVVGFGTSKLTKKLLRLCQCLNSATSAWCSLDFPCIVAFCSLDSLWERRPGWAESSHISHPDGCISGCQQRAYLCSHPGFSGCHMQGLNYSDILCALCNIAGNHLRTLFNVYLIPLGGFAIFQTCSCLFFNPCKGYK